MRGYTESLLSTQGQEKNTAHIEIFTDFWEHKEWIKEELRVNDVKKLRKIDAPKS
jgi:LEA14-like dessication related protein